MRGYTFECKDQETRDNIFKEFGLAVKESRDYLLRDIILFCWNGSENDPNNKNFYFGFFVADCVVGCYNFASINAIGQNLNTKFMIVKANFPDVSIVIPNDVKISCEYDEDAPNNFKTMVKMYNSGKKRQEIEEKFDQLDDAQWNRIEQTAKDVRGRV